MRGFGARKDSGDLRSQRVAPAGSVAGYGRYSGGAGAYHARAPATPLNARNCCYSH